MVKHGSEVAGIKVQFLFWTLIHYLIISFKYKNYIVFIFR